MQKADAWMLSHRDPWQLQTRMYLTGFVHRVHCMGQHLTTSVDAVSGDAGSRSKLAAEDKGGFVITLKPLMSLIMRAILSRRSSFWMLSSLFTCMSQTTCEQSCITACFCNQHFTRQGALP